LGFRVNGNVAPESANPVPVNEAALTVTAEVPVEVRVRVSVAGIFVTASPKSMLDVLKLRIGDEAFRSSVKISETLPALAVRIAVSAELTGDTFTVKLALIEPAATVTEAGTVASELLLERLTTKPPLAAAVFKVAVQLSVPVPAIAPLVQFRALSTGTPVPLRTMTVEPPPEELLVKDSCPLSAPAAVGSNCTLNVVVCPGASVTGRPPPEIEKPVPDNDAALTVTGMVPVEERTSGSVTAEFTGTLPKGTLEALIPNTAKAAFN